MAEVTPSDTSVDVICDSAAEFMTLLDPLRGLFTSGTYIFRGVSSELHTLLPSAHRADVHLLYSDYQPVVGPLGMVADQCAAEFYTLDKFFGIVSRNGVRVPEDTYVLREELDEWRILFRQSDTSVLRDRVWPSLRLFSLVALAQHYGIPTRALDWTWSAQTATYFAARPALDRSTEGYIAVWAVDDFTRQMDQFLAFDAERPLKVFTVSGADNTNLRAQRGLFMLPPQRLNGAHEPFVPTEYDRLLRESLPVLKDAVRFIRVLISRTEARQVLAYLARAGVTAGTLYPGLWGAAREYEDDRMIDAASLRSLSNINTIGLWDRIHNASRPTGA